MKKQTELSIRLLGRLTNGRIQLFNKHFYRLQEGKVTRQFIEFENGKKNFVDFGKEQELATVFQQIKILFDPKGKVVATRLSVNEPLVAKKDSMWAKETLSKRQKHLNELAKRSERFLQFEEDNWVEETKRYWHNRQTST